MYAQEEWSEHCHECVIIRHVAFFGRDRRFIYISVRVRTSKFTHQILRASWMEIFFCYDNEKKKNNIDDAIKNNKANTYKSRAGQK